MSKIEFIDAFCRNMQERYHYSPRYSRIRVGMVANLGIRTWHDLMSVDEKIFESGRIDKKTKDLLLDMKRKELYHASGYAAYCVFFGKKLTRFYNAFVRSKGSRLISDIFALSSEELLKIKGIGKKGVEYILSLKSDESWKRIWNDCFRSYMFTEFGLVVDYVEEPI